TAARHLRRKSEGRWDRGPPAEWYWQALSDRHRLVRSWPSSCLFMGLSRGDRAGPDHEPYRTVADLPSERYCRVRRVQERCIMADPEIVALRELFASRPKITDLTERRKAMDAMAQAFPTAAD